jgi:hypothetical protein
MQVRTSIGRRFALALSWTIILLVAAACTEARRPKRTKAEKPEAQQPAIAQPVPVAPVDPATAPADAPGAPAAPVAVATPPAAMTSVTSLRVTLPGKMRFGAFALLVTWDPALFSLSEPKPEPALSGYMCQANVAQPGTIRFNCVGLTGEERGGLLATIPVQFKDRAPTVEDFKVVQNEVVDEMGQTLAEVHVQLAVDPAHP